MRPCPQCAVKSAQIALLKLQIERLHQIIHKLVRLIKHIEHDASEVYRESDRIARGSGYAPEFYIWHKSRWIVARCVLRIIKQG